MRCPCKGPKSLWDEEENGREEVLGRCSGDRREGEKRGLKELTRAMDEREEQRQRQRQRGMKMR